MSEYESVSGTVYLSLKIGHYFIFHLFSLCFRVIANHRLELIKAYQWEASSVMSKISCLSY